jgi:hypothetical protein
VYLDNSNSLAKDRYNIWNSSKQNNHQTQAAKNHQTQAAKVCKNNLRKKFTHHARDGH